MYKQHLPACEVFRSGFLRELHNMGPHFLHGSVYIIHFQYFIWKENKFYFKGGNWLDWYTLSFPWHAKYIMANIHILEFICISQIIKGIITQEYHSFMHVYVCIYECMKHIITGFKKCKKYGRVFVLRSNFHLPTKNKLRLNLNRFISNW